LPARSCHDVNPKHWINDRIYPWRPFVYVPRAFAIDALIQQVLGPAMFAQITLK
jgi:hypothetical protein